jgi:hypothetical protein
MTIGPVSYTVIAFPGNQFNGNVAPEVAKLVADGTVRILDLVFVAKDEQGDTISIEFDQMDELAAFNDIDGEVGRAVRRGGTRLGWGPHRQRPHPCRPRRVSLRRAGRGIEELSTDRPKKDHRSKKEGARPCQ